MERMNSLRRISLIGSQAIGGGFLGASDRNQAIRKRYDSLHDIESKKKEKRLIAKLDECPLEEEESYEEMYSGLDPKKIKKTKNEIRIKSRQNIVGAGDNKIKANSKLRTSLLLKDQKNNVKDIRELTSSSEDNEGDFEYI